MNNRLINDCAEEFARRLKVELNALHAEGKTIGLTALYERLWALLADYEGRADRQQERLYGPTKNN